MRAILLLSILLFIISSCFKDKPNFEFSKVAGSWKIEEVTVENFDTLGNSITETTFNDCGYIMLSFNEGELAQNSLNFVPNFDNVAFKDSSFISYVLGNCDRWDVSVGAEHINFGYDDTDVPGYTHLLIMLTVSKLNSKHMHWMNIKRNPSGTIARKEVFIMKRSN